MMNPSALSPGQRYNWAARQRGSSSRWMGRRGGGGGGGPVGPPSYQAQALANPEPVNYSTPADPGQQAVNTEWQNYYNQLNQQNTQEAQLAQQQQRDLQSGRMKEVMEESKSRGMGGMDPTLAATRARDEGARTSARLGAELAVGQMKERANTLSGWGGSATAQANTRLNLMGEQRMARLGEQQMALQRAELQARLNEAPYQRLMEMLGLVGQYGGSFGGLTGGGGWGTAPGSAGIGGMGGGGGGYSGGFFGSGGGGLGGWGS